MMYAIRPRDTKPELIIRRGLHGLGYRYRLHAGKLPGRPDLVFPSRRAAIFVNGCFWHGHDCRLFRWPSTRPEFWRVKICGNIASDHRNRAALHEIGWRVLDVWECTLKGPERRPLEDVIGACAAFLEGAEAYASVGWPQTVTIEDSA